MPHQPNPLLKKSVESGVDTQLLARPLDRSMSQIGNLSAQQTALYYRPASKSDLERTVLAAMSKLDSAQQ